MNKQSELENKLQELETDKRYWEMYPPVNWLGKWYQKVRLEKINKQIEKLKKELWENN